jgi:type I restriction enzyme M protein
MIDPQVGETIYDPAAGTAGFLVAAYNHIRLAHSTPAGIHDADVDGKPQRRGIGDRLSVAHIAQLQTATFYGNDVDPKMVRLATMNLTLRGLPDVRILLRNVLTTALDAAQKAELGIPAEGYHVVLANPPFSGRVDKDRIVDDVKVGTTTATELLFLKYMLDSLRRGGRCGVIVPEGVLFGSTGAHKSCAASSSKTTASKPCSACPAASSSPIPASRPRCCSSRKAAAPSGAVSARRLRRLQARRQPRHPGGRRRPARPRRHLAPARSPRRRLAGPRPRRRMDRKVVVRRRRRTARQRLQPLRRPLPPHERSTVTHRNPRELLEELAAIETEIAEEVEALRAVLGRGYDAFLLIPGGGY